MSLKGFFNQVFHRGKISLRHVFALFSFIFVVWALYRYFPGLFPTWFEELVLKPLFWLTPTFWLVQKIEREKWASLGWTKKNFFPSLYWGIGLGLVFTFEGLLANIFKYQGLNLVSLDYTPLAFLGLIGLSFVTAFTEETVFRGYIFSRLWRLWQKEGLANLVSSFLFALVYLPVAVFVLSYQPLVLMVYLSLVFLYGFAAAFVFARTNNLVASCLLHVFWSWPIILFH